MSCSGGNFCSTVSVPLTSAKSCEALPAVPLAWQGAGLALMVLGYSVSTWAMAVNRFFSAVVRIQTDRGHTTVTTGPYRFVRHPSYIGGILAYLALPVFLGTLWALVPVGVTAILTVVRTALEDRTLLAETPLNHSPPTLRQAKGHPLSVQRRGGRV